MEPELYFKKERRKSRLQKKKKRGLSWAYIRTHIVKNKKRDDKFWSPVSGKKNCTGSKTCLLPRPGVSQHFVMYTQKVWGPDASILDIAGSYIKWLHKPAAHPWHLQHLTYVQASVRGSDASTLFHIAGNYIKWLHKPAAHPEHILHVRSVSVRGSDVSTFFLHCRK